MTTWSGHVSELPHAYLNQLKKEVIKFAMSLACGPDAVTDVDYSHAADVLQQYLSAVASLDVALAPQHYSKAWAALLSQANVGPCSLRKLAPF